MAHDPTKKEPANLVTDPNLDEEIRRRAYALYGQRGRKDGHDLDDWLHAEAELMRQGYENRRLTSAHQSTHKRRQSCGLSSLFC